MGDWYAQFKMTKEAINLYKHACEKFQYPRSCYKYGISLLDGADVGCETDPVKVMAWIFVGCGILPVLVIITIIFAIFRQFTILLRHVMEVSKRDVGVTPKYYSNNESFQR